MYLPESQINYWKMKKHQVSNLLTFGLMILMNVLANALPIGGLTTGEVSQRFDNLFVPAGQTFAIWGLIYLFLGVFVIRTLVNSKDELTAKVVKSTGPWVSANFLLNGAWIIAWHHLYVGLSWLIMIAILLSLLIVYVRLVAFEFSVLSKNWWFMFVPFSLYLSWICVAMVANGAAYFTELGSPFPWPESYSLVIMASLAIIFAGFLKMRFDDPVPVWVLAWAFFGIFTKYGGRVDVPLFPLTFLQWSTVGLTLLSLFFLMNMVYRKFRNA